MPQAASANTLAVFAFVGFWLLVTGGVALACGRWAEREQAERQHQHLEAGERDPARRDVVSHMSGP